MFAQPQLLWLLLLLPLVGGLWAYARWRRRRSFQRLGNPFRVERLTLVRPWRRRLAQASIALALAATILGLARPRWGLEKVETRAAHQDLVVVLDVSRSMLAEQPSRLERAVRSLEHLNEALRPRGAVRLGLVLGAAYPRLQLPPSQDYDHFEFLLERARHGDLPPELWRGPTEAVSGTRLGTALARAVDLYRPEQTRSFELLLVSDGDDPVDDDEWLKGVQAAREKNIPIHVLAIGDPGRGFPVPEGRSGTETLLNETRLQDIARRTEGSYIPAHTLTQIPLGSLIKEIQTTRRIQETLQPDPSPERMQPRPRQAWFYLLALACLCLSLLFQDGKASPFAPRVSARALIVPIALLLVSAGPRAAVEEFIRQGNDAFAREDFEQALRLYDQAQGRTLDPGLVAFNRGTTLYRLGNYRDAAAEFQRALEDEAAPLQRRQKAHYDLGTALLGAAADDADSLRRAVHAFRACLELEPDDVNLRDDARFNLELARRLWLKAIAQDPDGGDPGASDPDPGKETDEKANDQPKGDDKSGKNGDKTPAAFDSFSKDKIEGKDTTQAPGGRLVLPDQADLEELSPEQMRLLLRDQVERIAQERRTDRRAASKSLGDAPNW